MIAASVHVAEVREDVQPEVPLVLLAGAGLEVAFGDPPLGVLA